MNKGCGYSNSYSTCKHGWVYEPDNFGCVQSALCPQCDGDGGMTEKKPKFDVKLELTYQKSYRVRAKSQADAVEICKLRAQRRTKALKNLNMTFVSAVLPK